MRTVVFSRNFLSGFVLRRQRHERLPLRSLTERSCRYRRSHSLHRCSGTRLTPRARDSLAIWFPRCACSIDGIHPRRRRSFCRGRGPAPGLRSGLACGIASPWAVASSAHRAWRAIRWGTSLREPLIAAVTAISAAAPALRNRKKIARDEFSLLLCALRLFFMVCSFLSWFGFFIFAVLVSSSHQSPREWFKPGRSAISSAPPPRTAPWWCNSRVDSKGP
jgi:hypothetical protein